MKLGNFKNLVKYIFKRLKYGSDYKSVYPVLKAESSENLVIEVLGPSGAGKSTLINELSKTRFFRKTYIKVKDKYHNSEALENWEMEFIRLAAYEMHTTWLFSKNCNQLKKKLLVDLELSKRKGAFIIDEGVAYGFNYVYQNLSQNSKTEMYTRFKHKLIINLTTKDPQRIVNQIYKRSKKGHTHPAHVNKTDAELLQKTEISLKQNNQKADILRDLGCEVLTLDIDNTISYNVQKVTKHIFDN